MKKFIAVALAVALMLAFASQAMGLVIATPAGAKKPPLYINKLVVSDPYLNPFDVKNWSGALSSVAYPAGSQIWFIAELIVAAFGDTDAAYMWDGGSYVDTNNDGVADDWATDPDGATLTFTGKDNCLSFTGSTWATFAVISGQNVTTASVLNNANVVSALESKAEFYLSTLDLAPAIANGAFIFPETVGSLAQLEMAYVMDEVVRNTVGSVIWGGLTARATAAKTYYLHFMATTKAATEGVCIGTLTIGGGSKFENATYFDGAANYSKSTQLKTFDATPTTALCGTNSLTNVRISDRSFIYNLFNTVNGKQYTIMKLNNDGGPYGGGVMYVLMNGDNDKNIISFVVKDDQFKGLSKFRNDNGAPTFDVNGSALIPWNYDAVASNDLSNSYVAAQYAAVGRSTGDAIGKADLQAIFDFFGFAYANPVAPGDANFLKSNGFTSVAEAKYNVANAVVPTPDIEVLIPQTGDAASSTGLILAVSAILAAAAAGFVLSKRARV